MSGPPPTVNRCSASPAGNMRLPKTAGRAKGGTRPVQPPAAAGHRRQPLRVKPQVQIGCPSVVAPPPYVIAQVLVVDAWVADAAQPVPDAEPIVTTTPADVL